MRNRRREPSWLWPWDLLRGYLVIGSLVLAFAFLVYTQSVVNRVERQSNAAVRILRRLLESEAADTSRTEISHLSPLFMEIRSILEENLPVVVTDTEGLVLMSVGIRAVEGISVSDQSEEVQKTIEHLQHTHGTMTLRIHEGGELIGYVYWGDNKILRELRWIPPLEVAIVGVFVLIGLMGLRRLKAVEQRSLWFGMAREAAHQLGTPITSLLGWIELLKEHEPAGETGPREIALEMEQDIARLAKISRRFERIGFPPNLEIMDVKPLLQDTANYFRARLPRQSAHVELIEEYTRMAPIRANRDLFTWVLENLIRNGIESLDGDGTITLRGFMEPRAREVCIHIEDTGCGMTGRIQSRAFRAGFTTKERGWGLGLAMAHRIISEYHGGRIRIVRSNARQGTLMEITIPAVVRGEK